jgi:hypothetical protein
MIARLWWGDAYVSGADPYLDHLRTTLLPELEAIPGFRGLTVIARREGVIVRHGVLTYWDSEEAVRAFAPELRRAVVPDAVQPLLAGFDDTVTHWEVLLEHTVNAHPERSQADGSG